MHNSEIKEVKIEEVEEYRQHFNEKELWEKVSKVARKAGIKVVYACLLLYYALRSPDISLQAKATIIGALGYFILPLDFVPDFVPLLGFTDDLGALLFAIGQVSLHLTPDIRFKAKDKLGEWFGEYDVAELVEVDNAAEKDER